jgi:hypothetical protein
LAPDLQPAESSTSSSTSEYGIFSSFVPPMSRSGPHACAVASPSSVTVAQRPPRSGREPCRNRYRWRQRRRQAVRRNRRRPH